MITTSEYTISGTTIIYSAHKAICGGYMPVVSVNGNYVWTTARNTKTLAGAMNKAKRIAQQISLGKSQVAIIRREPKG